MGDVGDGGRSSGRPPFIPITSWDEPNPFTDLPYGGYERYLRDLDDPRGTWASMLTPGASGAALMVTGLNAFICCAQVDLRAGYCLDMQGVGEVPMLLPGLVKWRSVIGEDGYVFPEVASTWQDGLCFPPVGIIEEQFVDCSWLAKVCNIVLPQESMDIDETWPLEGVDGAWISGLVAPWQLLPISPAAEMHLLATLREAPSRWYTHVLGFTNCELGEYAYESVDGNWTPADYAYQTYEQGRVFHDHHDECVWTPGRPECPCGEPPTNLQALEGLVAAFSRPGAIEAMLVPQFLRQAWLTLLTRYNDTFETVEHRGRGLGDLWSTSCLLRLSPFWDISSHDLQRQALSLLSTISPTLPDLSVAYSQQSMPFE